MAEVGLIEAWRIWFAGQSPNDLTLWGIEMLWWARIGTFLQGISFLVIIIELIGYDRINGFGGWLEKSIRLELRQASMDILDWVALLLSKLSPLMEPIINPIGVFRNSISELRGSIKREGEDFDSNLFTRPSSSSFSELYGLEEPRMSLWEVLKEKPLPAAIWVMASIAGYITYFVWLGPLLGDDWTTTLVHLVAIVGILVVVAPVVALVIANIGLVFVMALNMLLVRPVAGVLAGANLNLIVKIGAGLVALAGFHFAILSG